MLTNRVMMAVALALITGCSQQPRLPEAAVQCDAPRPEVCPMFYAPVCGYRDAEATKTYSNGCSACGDPAVTGFVDGACL